MTDQNMEVASRLEQKIKIIMDLYLKQKEMLARFSEENAELKLQLAGKTDECREWQKKSERLMIGSAFVEAANGGSHEAKIKINRIVREIDNCIALLNR